MSNLTTQETLADALILPEAQTWVSAFVDGETALPAAGFREETVISHQYYHYQLIRQTLRGLSFASSSETISWHQTQFSKLWAHVDAQSAVQDA